jgi:hypothetical protein
MDQPGPIGTRYGVPALREQIVSRLTQAYGENMLDQREFERRLEQAQRAETIEELHRIVADFGGEFRPEAGAQPRSRESQRVTTFLSNHQRELEPFHERNYQCLTILGNTTLDLRRLRGSGATVVVTLSGFLSESRLRVPLGTKVLRENHLVLGELRIKLAGQPGTLIRLIKKLVSSGERSPESPFPADGPPPTLILRGTMVMGSIRVKEEN